jgi:CHAD domain-containing protein
MGGDVDAREVEWQLDAVDLRPVVRWLSEPARWEGAGAVRVARAGNDNHVDLYLDTHDRRFQRAGYALRIRRPIRNDGQVGEAKLKSLDPPAGGESGLRSRRELAESIESSEPAALATAPGVVGERVRAVAGTRPLLSLFEVRTRRRVFSLEADGVPSAEIGLDETAIRPADGGAPARIRRVEIELPEPGVPMFEPFVERLRVDCGLQPARLSKYEAGLLSADLRPPRSETFGPTEIHADMPIGAVAIAVLRRHFSAFVAKEPGTRLGDDIEELHDMRVASRRLRAALSLFADVLPAHAQGFRTELGWLGQTLGAVRDLDVQLEQLDEWLTKLPQADRDALGALRSLLENERAEARASMLAALDSRRYEAFATRFGRFLRARRARVSGQAARPAGIVAPELLEARFRKLRARGDRIVPTSNPEELHRVRIQGKRLRYALEFLTEVYPKETRPLIKRLVALQDILGEHQDADVAIARLRALAVEHGGELEPATVFAMGEVAERYRLSMASLRAQFPSAYGRVKKRAGKSIRKLLEEQRPGEPPCGHPGPVAESSP